VDAVNDADHILPVYVFDERVFKGKTRRFGFPKTGNHRARFILESVRDLRERLRERGADLLIRVGKPEEIIPDLVQQSLASWVYCNRERTEEEVQVQDRLEKKLWSIGREIRYARGKMLYYTADLPFPVPQTPDVFTQFRKEIERYVSIREPLPIPERIEIARDELDYGELPTLAELGKEAPSSDHRAVSDFVGGESQALRELDYYLWQTHHVATYKETRNGLLGRDYSTKFSAWLAQGCLSPKTIYAELKKFEQEVVENDSTYWVFFELLWRDFFRFQAKKHGNKIFLKGGIKEEADPGWREDRERFERWANGQTGIPFIDANMREINATGFMSNRGRQNVASFLVRDLHINWQMGAEYFESVLIDYDVTSNWGNWNYVAGVGADPRENRYFNILSQAQRYDENAAYVKAWCPELADVPAERIHRPDTWTDQDQRDFGVQLGVDYPNPIIPTKKWVKRPKRGRKRSRSMH
jgi:deoxyribodipyrimidine photo-lyase